MFSTELLKIQEAYDKICNAVDNCSVIVESELDDIIASDDKVYISPSVSQIKEIYDILNRSVFENSLPSDYRIVKRTDCGEYYNAEIDYTFGKDGALVYNDAYKNTMKSLVSLIGHEMCHIFDKTDYKLHASVHGKEFNRILGRLEDAGIAEHDNSILNIDNPEVKRWINDNRVNYRLLVLSGDGWYGKNGGVCLKVKTALVKKSIDFMKSESCLDSDGSYGTEGLKKIEVYSLGSNFDVREDSFIELKLSSIGKSRITAYYKDSVFSAYDGYEKEYEIDF